MIRLASPDWASLKTAYGSAIDIPTYIQKIASAPHDEHSLAWFNLWSALCHQGDCFTASYAAVPHLIDLRRFATGELRADFLLLPAAIEISRHGGRGPDVPSELAIDYFDAIQSMGGLVGELVSSPRSELDTRANLVAIAVSKGQHGLGQAILNLDDDLISRINAGDV